MNRIVGIVLAVIGLGAIAYLAFPGFRAKVDDIRDKHLGWTPEARRKDPVGFIDYSIGKLNENIGKFEQARGDLTLASKKLTDLGGENEAKIAFAEKQLEAFKGAYKEAKGGKGFPVTVAGASYDEPSLKSQVTLLLSQKGGFEAIVKQITAGAENAKKRELDLINRISESKSKLSLLQAQREIVKVSKLTADTEKLLAEVNDVLAENEAFAQKSSVRTVEEIMKDADAAKSALSSPEAEAFLNS